MKPGPALLLHSFRRMRLLVLGAGAILAGFQILLCLAAKTVAEADAFGPLLALIPDYLRQLLGPAAVSLMSFKGLVGVGYFHFAVVAATVGLVIAIATEVSGEVETRFVDLLLSRPLARHWLITRSAVLLAGAALGLLLAMIAGTLLGLWWFAPAAAVQPSLVLVRSLALNLGALLFCWGGLALAVAAAARRRSVAGAIVGLLALSTYLFDYIAQTWKPTATLASLLPFHYYNALHLLSSSTLHVRDIGILLGFGLAGTAVAYLWFSRRDL
jgi:ABC-2 type transport system permease protein